MGCFIYYDNKFLKLISEFYIYNTIQNMSRDKQEDFSIDIDTDIYRDYNMNMPYFELKIATISQDCDSLDYNYNYHYDLDDIHTMKHNLGNFEIYFDDIDIDNLVYVETYYCIPEESNTFVERVYQSPKYTEEQINELDFDLF